MPPRMATATAIAAPCATSKANMRGMVPRGVRRRERRVADRGGGPDDRGMAARLAAVVAFALSLPCQQQAPQQVLRCAHLLAADGASFVDDRIVQLDGDRIVAIEPAAADAKVDATLDGYVIPGLIDLHTHLLLHPYDEASWDDQVLKESTELRTIRATLAAAATLRSGFVAVRDLGTEGAGFADVALRTAIAQGMIPGPRVFASTRAIVALGCYGPNLATGAPHKGAQEVNGADAARAAAREQIAAGADWIKVYADYRRAPGAASTPTLSDVELRAICYEAQSAGVPVAAHASTDEGIRRAVFAGVRTIEHGTQASDQTLQLMAEHGVVLCPCLAANEAIVRYAGRRGPAAARLDPGRVTVQRALLKGVTVACGTDAGVFRHGDNARELELLVAAGMTPVQALATATRTAAAVLGRTDELGAIAVGARPGLVVLSGDPLADIAAVRQVVAVWVGGKSVAR